jgi:hypothetical protein
MRKQLSFIKKNKRGHAMIKKAPFAVGIMFLFVALAFQASALTPSPNSIEAQEANAVDSLMNNIEKAASQSTSESQFFDKILSLSNGPDFHRFPILHEILGKVLGFMTGINHGFLKGTSLGNQLSNLIDRISPNARPDFLVISYGIYKRHNPFKQNTITHLKPGLSMWRYSAASVLIKGKTLVLERKPFGIHQRVVGPQIGLMRGFKGIYLDHESKLTGNSYVFFLGHAHKIRVFDITPFSK